jgi:hypothetical protein
MLHRVWQELGYMIYICPVTKGRHIEHLWGRTETWSVSPSVDMLPFVVTVPAAVPQRSEIPEGLMNYPVRFSLTFLKVCVYFSLLTFFSLRSHAFRIVQIQFYVAIFSVSGFAKERTVPSS